MPSNSATEVARALEKAQHILRVKIDAGLRGLALTAPQYTVLATLSAAADLSGAALARRCFVTPQTMTGILANLRNAGLIERIADLDHGRILKARLTSRGREVLANAHVVVREIEERLVSDLDRAEREALADLLGQCVTSLEQA